MLEFHLNELKHLQRFPESGEDRWSEWSPEDDRLPSSGRKDQHKLLTELVVSKRNKKENVWLEKLQDMYKENLA